MTSTKKAVFESLAFPLMNKLYSYALQLTRDQMDAEDLVQETYMKAWRFFENFKQGSNFQAWLFRIMTNGYIDFYNKKKRRDNKMVSYNDSYETDQAEDKEQPAPGDWQDFDYEQIFGDEVSRALNKLPEHYRTVVLLSDVNEFKYKEIAKILNCPIGTVMSRLNRGRTILARHLKSYALEGGVINKTAFGTV